MEINMSDRKWLPTLADLVDRLSILNVRSAVTGDNTKETKHERWQIQSDIYLYEDKMTAEDRVAMDGAYEEVYQINKEIWELKDKMAELMPTDEEYKDLLVKAHLVNSKKNIFKNQLLNLSGELNESTKRTIFK
jgi:hypothetical protein